jgi:putative oxidoreductase
MSAIEKFGPLVGRILIASLFVPFGIGKLGNFNGIVAYIASKNLPLPQVAAAGTIFVEIVVGLALLVGFKTRYAALILAIFTVLAAIIFHNYWASPEAMVVAQKTNFFKNMAIAGGLLFVAAFGAGPLSVDNRGR